MSEEASKASEKKKRSGWYMAARAFAAIVLNTLCPVTYHNAERAAGDAPFIIIANHSSWIDPVVMAKPIKRYEVTYLGKKELLKNPIARRILTNMHCIPVDRHHTDMVAMRACLTALKKNEVLGIFPEGTRHHKGLMEEMEGGVALIALRAGVPLIPMMILPKVRCFHRSHCYVGEPIPLEDLRAKGVNKETCQELMERISAVYAAMAAEAAKK